MLQVDPPESSSSSSSIKCKLHNLITGYESHMFWSNNVTAPPYVTHDSSNGQRYCHHLYGKMTREGRFIFEGDRFAHPTMHPLASII